MVEPERASCIGQTNMFVVNKLLTWIRDTISLGKKKFLLFNKIIKARKT